MNLALIGYRGTGKTTIAQIIARKTGYELKNLDALIVEKRGMSIPQIVEKYGWESFRDTESEVLERVSRGERRVLDCGGGVILRKENREKLKRTGPVVWLTAPVGVIVDRIRGDDQRPSLTGNSFIEEVEQVLAQREPLYREAADHEVRTDILAPEEAADEIIELTGI